MVARRMVTRPRLRAFFTALGLYTMAALLIGYFGVNAYTGNHGLKARAEIDAQIADLNSQRDAARRSVSAGSAGSRSLAAMASIPTCSTSVPACFWSGSIRTIWC